MLGNDDEPKLIEADEDAARRAKPSADMKPEKLPTQVVPTQVAATEDDIRGADRGASESSAADAVRPVTMASKVRRGSVSSDARLARRPHDIIDHGVVALDAIRASIEDARELLADPLAMAVHRLEDRDRAHVCAVLDVLDRIEADRSV